MEISLTDGGNLATIILVAVGLLLQSWRQGLARQKQDEVIRQRFINNADQQAKDIEKLRSKIEENESRYQEDKRADAKRHQLELEARDQVIRNLEATIIERLEQEQRDRIAREATELQEREYYRETINDMRIDTRDMVQLTLNAQDEAKRRQSENEKLTNDNRNLNVTVTGQREQILQLTTRLEHLQEERNQLQKDLEALQAAQQENEQLRAEILGLKEQIRQKDLEIERLNREIEALKKGNLNPISSSAGLAGELAKLKPEGNDPL